MVAPAKREPTTARLDLPVFQEPRAAYIHVPFCAHRCGYCDFTLVAGRDDLVGDYLNAMARELQTLERPRTVETLFIGGGTPTHLSVSQLSELLTLLRHWFPLDRGGEYSIEANPHGLTAEKVHVLADAGVNRVSLGVQSFDPHVLLLLERDHRRAGILQAVELLRRRIENFSLDLIFGVPGQTLDVWRQSLAEAIALQPAHISTYGLTFEKGTAFWTRREHGDLVPIADELEREMYGWAMDALAAAGFEQYEISNFARAGFACRHNRVYWEGKPYFGFGPGAARYLNGCRELNHRSVTTWLKRVERGESPIADSERLDPEDRAREALVLRLRTVEGVFRDRFREQTGFEVEQLASAAIRKHRRAGLLEDDGVRLHLTREGRFLADTVIVDFL